jgi:hypothetical protein
MPPNFFGPFRRKAEFGSRRSASRSRSSHRIRQAIERLEDRRMLTATLTQVSSTLLFTYTAASAAPSITGIDGALIFSTGGGESVSLGGGVAGATIVNGAIVTNSSSFTKIEISGPGGGTETFSVLATGLNIGEAFQIDSTVNQASFAGALTATSVSSSTTTDLNGGSVATSGTQTYNDAVTIGATTTLTTTTTGNIVLNDTTTGNQDLTMSSAAGITFAAAVNMAAGKNLSGTAVGNIAFSGAGNINAAGGNVSLTNNTAAGAVTSGTATTDITTGAGTILLSSGSGGIGASGNPLVVSGANLDATTTGNANQFLSANPAITIDPLGVGLSAGTGTIELDGGTFNLGASNQINNNSKLTVNGATFGVSTFNQTVNTLTLASGNLTGTTGVITSTNIRFSTN